jgi:hypothetical protein
MATIYKKKKKKKGKKRVGCSRRVMGRGHVSREDLFSMKLLSLSLSLSRLLFPSPKHGWGIHSPPSLQSGARATPVVAARLLEAAKRAKLCSFSLSFSGLLGGRHKFQGLASTAPRPPPHLLSILTHTHTYICIYTYIYAVRASQQPSSY